LRGDVSADLRVDSRRRNHRRAPQRKPADGRHGGQHGGRRRGDRRTGQDALQDCPGLRGRSGRAGGVTHQLARTTDDRRPGPHGWIYRRLAVLPDDLDLGEALERWWWRHGRRQGRRRWRPVSKLDRLAPVVFARRPGGWVPFWVTSENRSAEAKHSLK